MGRYVRALRAGVLRRGRSRAGRGLCRNREVGATGGTDSPPARLPRNDGSGEAETTADARRGAAGAVGSRSAWPSDSGYVRAKCKKALDRGSRDEYNGRRILISNV